MAVHYRPFDGTRVSGRWHTVLKRARKNGVKFHVNSGHRSLREQQALFRQNMRFNGVRWVPRSGRPLTAFPSPLAPHIRSGRAAHALDVQMPQGEALVHWLRVRKVSVKFPVTGEPWHLEISGSDLKRLWKRYR